MHVSIYSALDLSFWVWERTQIYIGLDASGSGGTQTKNKRKRDCVRRNQQRCEGWKIQRGQNWLLTQVLRQSQALPRRLSKQTKPLGGQKFLFPTVSQIRLPTFQRENSHLLLNRVFQRPPSRCDSATDKMSIVKRFPPIRQLQRFRVNSSAGKIKVRCSPLFDHSEKNCSQ